MSITVAEKTDNYKAFKRQRKLWSIDPVEKIIPNKNKKSRQKQKLELKASDLFF